MATDPLSGDTAPSYPVITSNFSLSGTTVSGSGTTAAGKSDAFYGLAGVSYAVTIAADANLSTLFDNSAGTEVNGYVGVSDTTAANTPNGELIAIDSGTLVNHGTLNVYPKAPNANTHYNKTASVVFIGGSGTVDNFGSIGDEQTISNPTDPHYAYAQEDFCAIKLDGGSTPSTIVNEVGGVLSGYNAIFTAGSGTIDNYGTIYASNDCILSGFTIVNHVNAGLNSGVAGYASVHSYSNLTNYGYVIGNDYGILAAGNNAVINDYAGAAVAGVKNFDGSQVYNGEISALIRGTETPVTTGSFAGSDAVLLQSTGQTLNLYSGVVDGVNYLPIVLGPMVGGSNNGQSNTLNLIFSGLTAAQITGLQNAIAASRTVTNGVASYSGSYTVDSSHTYQWEYFTSVVLTPVPPVTTAAAISASLDTLETEAKSGMLAAFALSDPGTPVLTISAAQIVADHDALAKITSPYKIETAPEGARIGIAALTAAKFTAPANLASITFADGIDTFTATDPQAVVSRFYEVALNRAPDQPGLTDWVGLLDQGGSVTDIATAFVASVEFQADYGTLTDAQFINAIYKTALGRPADPAGLTGWEGALAAGQPRGVVVTGIANSAEFIADTEPALTKGIFALDPAAPEVARLYDAAFGRAPDGGGLAGWDAAIDAGLPFTTVAADFLNSAEAAARFGNTTNAQFVTDLYQTTLHRAPDAAGDAAWQGALDAGLLSRTQLLIGFSESAEHIANTNAAVYGNGTTSFGVSLDS